MSEKKNIRLVQSTGQNEKNKKREYVSEQKSKAAVFEHRISYQKRQKERRMKAKRTRTLMALIFIAILVAVLLLLTPIFNIRTLSVEGNNVVTAEELNEVLKPLVNQNLFRTGEAKIEKMLKELPYVDTVSVQKKLFPPSVQIAISEYTPAAVIRADSKNLLVNSSLHILEETDTQAENLPVITGVEVTEHKTGDTVKFSDEEKADVVITALTTLESTGILSKIIEIDVRNLSYIIMNYDDRITVQCGSQLDLERKLRLLKEAVMNESLAGNAQGTINLSETGKAIYTP